VRVEHVARSLGMSKRTLARKLADEGLNFSEIFQNLRQDLAVRYLEDGKLHVSKIAWLLGFNEVSAFTLRSSAGPERRRAKCDQPQLN
jgi:AraC-like DNA-binding protein